SNFATKLCSSNSITQAIAQSWPPRSKRTSYFASIPKPRPRPTARPTCAISGRSGNAEVKVLITTTGRPTATKREPDYNRDAQHDRHIDRPEPPPHHDWPGYRPPARWLFRPASAGRVQAGHRLLVKGHAQGTEQLVELSDRTGSDDRDDGR